ncbi:MAG: hypothetical protein JO301_10885 [Chitinophagaceae bacterium]|nr:hypothetical protein [Chitinophagaceae bacterium]
MKKLGFVAVCLSMLFLSACNKELSDNFTTYTGHPLNDTIWVRNLPSTAAVHELAQLLTPDIIVDSFETSKDTTLKYGDSLEISFTAGSCVGSTGAPVSGKVKLEILRVRKKGDFIKAFVPTSSNGYPIESAGSFFIRVSKEGKELGLAPGASVKIRFIDIEDTKSNMWVFYGRESSPLPVSGIDTAFSWTKGDDSSAVRQFQRSGPGNSIKGYELFSKNLRWINADRFNDTSKPKAKITAILPLNYTNKNTAVFAVFTDQRTVMSMKADFASRSFAASNIPLGTKLKIVTLSRIGDDLYLGTRDVNDVGTSVYYQISPEKKSLKDILSFLNGL